MCFGSVEEVCALAQLLPEDGPEGRLGAHHFDATHTCVNATLWKTHGNGLNQTSNLVYSSCIMSACFATTQLLSLLGQKENTPTYLLATLNLDLYDRPEASHVLQQDHSGR